nr:unnamed protein product [Callosobruchus chinensis]
MTQIQLQMYFTGKKKGIFCLTGERKLLRRNAVPIFWKDTKTSPSTSNSISCKTPIEEQPPRDQTSAYTRISEREDHLTSGIGTSPKFSNKPLKTYSRKRMPENFEGSDESEDIEILNCYNTTFSKKLAIKVKTMCKNERACAVLFDEIALKPKLDYNESFDYIEGYEDLGFLGRKNEIANSALVFYVRGLFCNWKVPLCYFTSKGPVKGDILAQLIKEVIEGLRRLQLIPVALVADQGTNNRNAYKILVIRNRCGYNPMPSVRQFRISSQYNINIRLQKALDSGNCEEDPQELLDLNVSASEINQSPNISNSTNPNENITSKQCEFHIG